MGGLLIVWDGTAAAERAVEVAAGQLDERHAIVLHVSRPADPSVSPDADASLLMRSVQLVQAGVAAADRHGLEATARVESSGRPTVDAILDVAADVDCSTIVLGADPAPAWLEELERRSPVPVLQVPAADAPA